MARIFATRYGADAIVRLRKVVAAAKHADPLAAVTIVVPNNLAGIVARRALAHGYRAPLEPGVTGLYLATLPRLAENIAAPILTAEGRRPATGQVVAATWRAVLSADPGVFGPVAEHPATIRALTAAHVELRDLDEPALDRAAGVSALAADLVRLHRDVTHRLHRHWYDTTDLLRTTARRCGEDAAATADLGLLVLYLPQVLTHAAAECAAALESAAELTVIVGRSGVWRADRDVLDSLPGLDVAATDLPPHRPIATEVRHASDSDDEVRCVVRDVVRTLGSTPAHRIAVLYGNSTPYARLLQEHFDAAGIAVNGAGVRAVHERATARFLLGMLELADRDLPRSDLFRLLSEVPVRATPGGDLVPVARWERISRVAGVVAGTGWRQRLDTYAGHERVSIAREEASEDPRPGLIERSRRSLDAALRLQDFATALRDRLRQGSELRRWSALSAWALALFHDLLGGPDDLTRLSAEEQYAAAAVETSLNGLAALDPIETTAGLQALRDVLGLDLRNALPRTGRFGEGVLVAPVSAAIGLDADVIYVVGLAEDLVPGLMHEDALLPERLRDATGGWLPSARARLDAQHRHLLAAFAGAPRVVASFPRGDLRRNTQRLPSRWLLPTLRELSGNHRLAATEWETAGGGWLIGSPSYAGTVAGIDTPGSDQEWRIRAAVARRSDDHTVDRALAMISARAGDSFTRYDGNLAGIDGLPDYSDGIRVVSPTALESYAVCPHAYFVGRMLRVQPIEQPEDILTISALDIGNLIHASMQDLVTEFAHDLPAFGEDWTAKQRARLLHIAETRAEQFEADGLTGHPRLWQRERQRILADLAWMLDDDAEWRRERSARIVASEMEFGMHGKDPVAVGVPGGQVLLRGSADKVDVSEKGTLFVTDIKTGSAARFADLGEDPVAGGAKLQLPVYAYAARQFLGDRSSDVEAAYWFVRKDRGKRVSISLTPAVEQRYAHALAVITESLAAGHFPVRAPEQPDVVWVQCEYCNPDRIGHGEARERWERKRHDPVLRAYTELVEPDAFSDGGGRR